MTARAAVQSILATDVASPVDGSLGDLGVQRVYAAGSLDTPPETCFLVVRWDPTGAVFGRTGGARVLVWAHDRNRTYVRLSDVLKRVADLLHDATHVAGSDGWTLTQATWRGESIDLVDNAFDTVTRWVAFDTSSRRT